MKLLKKNFVMDDFIKIYDNVLSQEACKTLIDLFDLSSYKEIINNKGTPNFTQLNINQKHPEHIKFLSQVTSGIVNLYKKDFVDYTRWYPPRLFLEEFRIKKYHSRSHDRFDIHVDVEDHASARRYLAFLYYLNDDFTGGETEFPHHNKKIVPKQGSVMVFPPTWQYPHAGLRVNKGIKYIMSTYCHYY
jgi:hypothetical protein